MAGLMMTGGVVLGVAPVPPRVLDILKGRERRVAREIATAIRATAGTSLGAIESSGNEIRALGGNVRIEVASRREAIKFQGTAHYHVTARLPNGAERGLDACVVGLGETEELALSDIAEIYVRFALPPLLSLMKPGAVSSVRVAPGTDDWGVPGFRAFVGPLGMRGPIGGTQALGDELNRSPLFKGLAYLPTDGRAHLLKVVLVARNGTWRRSLELDGQPTSIKDEHWTGAPAPPDFMSVVGFAAFERRDALASEGPRTAALKRLDARESWLFGKEVCPTEIMPQAFVDLPYSMNACTGGRLLDCLQECESGLASSCYSASLDLEAPGTFPPAATTLFLRACRLGYASACTNVAATRDAARSVGGSAISPDECSRRTFESVCDRAGDPWACAMFGKSLLEDKGPRDAVRIREVLGKSCKQSEDDPACKASNSMLGQLDGAKARP